MAGIDIISDSTGKEIVAAIQSTDVAQARILEINTAAEAKKNEVLESIPEDYSNISKEVDELKGDLGDISKLGVSIHNKYGVTTNKAIGEDGSIYTVNGWNITGFLPIGLVKKVYAECETESSTLMVGYYNNDKSFIDEYKRTTPVFLKSVGYFEPLNIGSYFRIAYSTDRISSLKALETNMVDKIIEEEPKLKYLLSNKSFTQGWFNVNGNMQTTDDQTIFNDWSAHKKYISVGNTKELIFKNRGDSVLSFLPYLFSNTNQPLELGKAFTVPKDGKFIYPIPDGVKFIHISLSSGDINTLNFEIYANEYDFDFDFEESFIDIEPLGTSFGDKLYTVSINGGGDYESIGAAYNASGRNGCIYVKSGRYTSVNPLSLDEAYLFGENRETTIISNTNAVYPNDALRVRSGVIEGFTLYATMTNPNDSGSYASHIDEDAYADKQLIFRNCAFISDYQASVGIGMRANQVLKFENCRFKSNMSASVFLHDWLQATYENKQYVIFENCIFESNGEYALQLGSVNEKNTLITTFINCTFKSKIYGKENCINIATATEKGYLCGNSIKLGAYSHGNNIDMLNAY